MNTGTPSRTSRTSRTSSHEPRPEPDCYQRSCTIHSYIPSVSTYSDKFIAGSLSSNLSFFNFADELSASSSKFEYPTLLFIVWLLFPCLIRPSTMLWLISLYDRLVKMGFVSFPIWIKSSPVQQLCLRCIWTVIWIEKCVCLVLLVARRMTLGVPQADRYEWNQDWLVSALWHYILFSIHKIQVTKYVSLGVRIDCLFKVEYFIIWSMLAVWDSICQDVEGIDDMWNRQVFFVLWGHQVPVTKM